MRHAAPSQTVFLMVRPRFFEFQFAAPLTFLFTSSVDTFKLFYTGESSDSPSEPIEVGLLNKGIAWSSDVNLKFGIPSNESKCLGLII